MLKKLMSRLLFVFAGGLFAIASMAANATLVAGSNSFVDTSTGLEWLQSGFTVGMTTNQVLASDAVKIDGYRIAKFADVQKLYLDTGAGTTYGMSASLAPVAETLLDLFGGCTSAVLGKPCGNADDYWFLGAWEFSEVRSYAYQPYGMFGVFRGTEGYVADENYFPGGTYSPNAIYRPDIATFLVREARVMAIPEPGTVALFLVGVLGVAASRRRTGCKARAQSSSIRSDLKNTCRQ